MHPITKSNNKNLAPGTDSFGKSSYYQETKQPLKSMPSNKPSLNVSMDRAFNKSNEFTANARHSTSFNTPSSSKSLSLWDQQQSPTASIKTAYNSSSSKESLWASAQSSPNSVQREQLKQQLFSNSSSLWENPSSKVSQASLMSKNDSNNSIWCTPPRMQSPPNNINSSNNSSFNGWENAVLNQTRDESINDSQALVRPQDLSPTDHHWNTSANGYNGNAIKSKLDQYDSKWNNTTSMGQSFNRINANAYTSTPIKPNAKQMANDTPADVNSFYMPMTTTASATTNGTTTTSAASSSCLQLFSDEFINYLNMIN